STAGMEASGTSNMKFALNGALTIGTLDGANVEMSEQIGHDHMFIFGLTAEEVNLRRNAGELDMSGLIAGSERLREALDAIRSGVFSPDEPHRYASLIQGLQHQDRFMVCADFDAYWEAQLAVEDYWRRSNQWWRSAILNCARAGWFSSDRSIREYAADIWQVKVGLEQGTAPK
ncbi:MAG TPA: glycogen/starch/alpha-glucan phosphorylase, partial [Pseudomonas sp.]|nr:glycogen/starch/alpha-glucan phosphorylase [Pseudomonas sp.]